MNKYNQKTISLTNKVPRTGTFVAISTLNLKCELTEDRVLVLADILSLALIIGFIRLLGWIFNRYYSTHRDFTLDESDHSERINDAMTRYDEEDD